jgi:hypothetical protein
MNSIFINYWITTYNSALLQDDVIAVISLQDIDGSWEFSEQLKELLQIPQSTQLTQGIVSY